MLMFTRSRNWLEKNASQEEIDRIGNEDPQIACSTMRGVQVRLALGLEFEADYDGKSIFVTGSANGGGCGYCVLVDDEIVFQADTIDDLANATIGNEKMKDIAPRWEITWSA